jgi:protein regulator of cytokinesis 1
MLAVRQEIEQLWLELMMSDEEKDEFVGFIDGESALVPIYSREQKLMPDAYTEELLKAHEEYSELLRSELESKATIIPKVREWHALVEEEEELERSAADPNRFKMRGGALLREEKLRKRVQILKPRVSYIRQAGWAVADCQIEGELLKLLPRWEIEAGRPFLIRGERVVDTIQNALEAKEAAKEAKKVSPQITIYSAKYIC